MWWLFPPDRLEGVMKDCKAVFDVRELEGEGGGIKILQRVCAGFYFPEIYCRMLSVGADEQEGEVMFVPSGWYHQVVNIDFVSLRYAQSIICFLVTPSLRFIRLHSDGEE